MFSLSLDADALLANLPHTRPVQVQAELDRLMAEHDRYDYSANDRSDALGVSGGGW